MLSKKKKREDKRGKKRDKGKGGGVGGGWGAAEEDESRGGIAKFCFLLMPERCL